MKVKWLDSIFFQAKKNEPGFAGMDFAMLLGKGAKPNTERSFRAGENERSCESQDNLTASNAHSTNPVRLFDKNSLR